MIEAKLLNNIEISFDDFIADDLGTRRRALHGFKSNILPKLTRRQLLQVFCSNYASEQSLQHILIEAISDDHSPQACREWALEILISCSQTAFCWEPKLIDQQHSYDATNEDDNSYQEPQNYDDLQHSFKHLYKLVCGLFYKRFVVLPNKDIAHRANYSRADSYTESSEEIRLGLVRLVSLLVSKFPEVNHLFIDTSDKSFEDDSDLTQGTSQICHSLSMSALYDTYPELTRESCALLQAITKRFPHVICKNAKDLLVPISGVISTDESTPIRQSKLPLFCHKHSKSRYLALDVSFHILSCYFRTQNIYQGVYLTHEVIKSWQLLIFDHSIQVRELLASVTGGLMKLLLNAISSSLKEGPCETILISCVEQIITLLLYLVSDDVPTVADTALEQMKQLYPRSSSFTCEAHHSISESTSPSVMLDTAHESTFICTSNIISKLISDASDKSSIIRVQRAIGALSAFIQVTCDLSVNLTDSNIHQIAGFLSDSVFDHDADLIPSCTNCALALGCDHSNGSAAISYLITAFNPYANNDAISSQSEKDACSTLSPRSFASKLCVVASILEGMLSDSSQGHKATSLELKFICSIITENVSLLGIHSSKELAGSLLKFCQIISSYERIEEIGFNIFLSCIILLACPESFEIKASVCNLLYTLSSGDMDGLYHKHFHRLVTFLTKPLKSDDFNMNEYWTVGDPYLLSFEVLLRTSSSSIIFEYFDRIFPIIEHHLCAMEALDYEMKIFMMALLESILSDGSLSPRLHEFLSSLLENSIIPNLVWKPGGKASAVRKLTAATLFTIIKMEDISPVILSASMPRLLPLLMSNLEDDDSVTRELVCFCLSFLFRTTPNTLDEVLTNELYPIILKTLDDSSDGVRLAACQMLENFLTASKLSAVKGTAIMQYIIECLLVHLDDRDEDFLRRISGVLDVIKKLDSESLLKALNSSEKPDSKIYFREKI